MSARSAVRLKAYQSLLLVRDLQNKRAEIKAREDSAEAQRRQSKAEAAQSAAQEAERLWLSNVTANVDPSLQLCWAQHALAQAQEASLSKHEALQAAEQARLAQGLWSAALAKLDVADALRKGAAAIRQKQLDEARLAAQEDRDLERRRRS